jgi:hypothetical protein
MPLKLNSLMSKGTLSAELATAESWDERVKMMQWWADRLDEMKRRDEIIHAPK